MSRWVMLTKDNESVYFDVEELFSIQPMNDGSRLAFKAETIILVDESPDEVYNKCFPNPLDKTE